MSGSTTFTVSGTFVVPDNVTEVEFDLRGEKGAAEFSAFATPPIAGGNGARLVGTVPVTPGETLTITMAGSGAGMGASGAGGRFAALYRGATLLAIAGGGGGAGAPSASTTSAGAGGAGGPGDPGADHTVSGATAHGGAGGVPGTGSTTGGSATDSGSGQAHGGGGGGGKGAGAAGEQGAAYGSGNLTGGGGGGGGASWATGTATVTHNGSGENAGAPAVTLNYNLAPLAPTALYPGGGVAIDRTVTNRFSWQFNDPNTDDTQSAFTLYYRLIGAPSWTSISSAVPDAFRDFASGSLATGSYEWQVETEDSLGVLGARSGSEYFSVANPPAGPVITAPANGATIGNNVSTLTWSVPHQDAYEVRTVADDAGAPDPATVYTSYSSSGTPSSATARSRGLTFDTNNRYEHAQVRIRYQGLWTPWSSVRLHVSFTPPAAPTLVLLTDDDAGTIEVLISHPAPTGGQPAVVASDVYRRQVKGGDVVAGSEKRLAVNQATSWINRTPASGADYQFRALARAGNGTSTYSAWTS